MGLRAWFQKLRSADREGDAERTPPTQASTAATPPVTAPQIAPGFPADEWLELTPYEPVDRVEHRHACVIAAAIAAGDRPTSSFTVTGVYRASGEYRRVACIAAAIAAGALPESKLIVKRIYKQRTLEETHAA